MIALIGTVYKLKKECLGNPAGTIGVVFNNYEDFDEPNKMGCQVIFENGEYDGFSVKDREIFLEQVGFSPSNSNYRFKNVMELNKDFKDGYWNFNKIKKSNFVTL